MIALTFIFEDHFINAIRNSDPGTNNWDVTIDDSLTGESNTITLTDREFGAVMALAISGDDAFSEAAIEELYSIAELTMERVSHNLRIIP